MEMVENKTFTHMIKGVGIAFLVTVILSIIFAMILTFTDVSETTISPVILIITSISILIGSTIGNHKIRKNGLLNGGAIGAIYMIIIYLISSILNGNFSVPWQSIVMIILGIVFGILGGIIGVNQK